MLLYSFTLWQPTNKPTYILVSYTQNSRISDFTVNLFSPIARTSWRTKSTVKSSSSWQTTGTVSVRSEAGNSCGWPPGASRPPPTCSKRWPYSCGPVAIRSHRTAWLDSTRLYGTLNILYASIFVLSVNFSLNYWNYDVTTKKPRKS